MTTATEWVTLIYRRSQESVRLCAVAANKSTSGQVPYLRQIRTFRVMGREVMYAEPGDIIADRHSRRLVIVETDHRPELPWSMLTAVYLRAVPVGSSARGLVCSVSRPRDVGGLNARREDEVTYHDVETVFIRSTITDTSEATATTKTAQDLAFLDRDIAAQLRIGWSLWDGSKRWRVDRVGDLERLDRLPYAIVTETGAT